MQPVPNRVRSNETPRYAEMQRIETMSGMDVGKSASSSTWFCCKDSDAGSDCRVLRRSSRQCRGFNQELSLESGRRGYVCALHWEGEWRSACRRLCTTPVGLALETMCDGHFGNDLKCAMHALPSGSSPGHIQRKNWVFGWPVPLQARLEVGVLLGRELADGDWWEAPELSNTRVHCRSLLSLA